MKLVCTRFPKSEGSLSQSDAVLMQRIVAGFQSPGSPMAMPPKGGNTNLTTKDIQAVLVYLQENFGVRVALSEADWELMEGRPMDAAARAPAPVRDGVSPGYARWIEGIASPRRGDHARSPELLRIATSGQPPATSGPDAPAQSSGALRRSPARASAQNSSC